MSSPPLASHLQSVGRAGGGGRWGGGGGLVGEGILLNPRTDRVSHDGENGLSVGHRFT